MVNEGISIMGIEARLQHQPRILVALVSIIGHVRYKAWIVRRQMY